MPTIVQKKEKYKNEHENNMLRLENELLEKSKNMSFGV